MPKYKTIYVYEQTHTALKEERAKTGVPVGRLVDTYVCGTTDTEKSIQHLLSLNLSDDLFVKLVNVVMGIRGEVPKEAK